MKHTLAILAVALTASGCASTQPMNQVTNTATPNTERAYAVQGETAFGSCLDKTSVRTGQGAGEAFLKLMLSPVTIIGCTALGTGEVVANWSEDTRENELRWKDTLTDTERAELAELQQQRGERGMYGYGGWSGPDINTTTIYTQHGGYQVNQIGNTVTVDQISTTR